MGSPDMISPIGQVVVGLICLLLGVILLIRRTARHERLERRFGRVVRNETFRKVFYLDVFVWGPAFLLMVGLVVFLAGVFRALG